MAIQLPTVNRMEPQSTPSVGRTNLTLPDRSGTVVDNVNSINDITLKAVDILEKQENAAIDTEVNRAVNELSAAHYEGLNGQNGTKYQKGNPVEIYKEFDSKMENTYQSILSRYSTTSQRAKNKIAARLEAKRGELNNSRITAFGQQYNEYENSTTDESVKLTQYEMLDATSTIDFDDPQGLAYFESKLGRIMDLRQQNALRTGQVTQLEDGTTAVEPGVQAKMMEDMSNGLRLSIKNFYTRSDSKSVETAEKMLERYGKFMLPDHRVTAQDGVNKAKKTVDAYAALTDVLDMDSKSAREELSTIKDPQTREKALELYDARTRRMDNITARASKEAFQTISIAIEERMNGQDPIGSLGELHEMDIYKQLIEDVRDPKQRKALQDMVQKPEKSSEEARAAAFGAIADGTLPLMSSTDLNLMLVGLDRGDAGRVKTIWIEANANKEAKTKTRASYLLNESEKSLTNLGRISKNSVGKYSKSEREMLNKAQEMILDRMRDLPANADLNQQRQFMNDIVKEVVEGRPAAKTSPSAINPSTTVNQTAAPGTNVDQVMNTMSDNDRLNYLDQYVAEKGVEPSNEVEFNNYIRLKLQGQ